MCSCQNQNPVDLDLDLYLRLEKMILSMGWEIPAELKNSCTICLNSMYNDLLQETTALQERRKLEGIFSILDPTSKEYQNISDRFSKTMSQRIVRIEQIHNKDLLSQYVAATAGSGSEDLYFHGSNNNNYVNIATKGFDITRSKNGLLGVGVYFAVNASYSNYYTDSLELPGSNVVKNMLMCRVYKIPSDQTGTDIICIKDDRRAYPMYIIYYRNVNEF